MSEGFEPVVRRKTYELVAERLLALISSEHLAPGDPLPPERELAGLYGVGRSSIREALRMLESKGAIRGDPNGGFAVAPRANAFDQSLGFLLSADQADLDELFEVRRIVESEAAALAAVRRDDPQLQRMAQQLEAMRAGPGSEVAFAEADLAFHLLIVEAARNRLLASLMEAIRTQLARALTLSLHVAGSAEATIESHGLILEAIAAGDGALARTRMQEHLARTEHEVGHGAVE